MYSLTADPKHHNCCLTSTPTHVRKEKQSGDFCSFMSFGEKELPVDVNLKVNVVSFQIFKKNLRCIFVLSEKMNATYF